VLQVAFIITAESLIPFRIYRNQGAGETNNSAKKPRKKQKEETPHLYAAATGTLLSYLLSLSHKAAQMVQSSSSPQTGG